jgi:hypothetical protein
MAGYCDHCQMLRVKLFEAEARLNNIKELSPYRKENTTRYLCKGRLVKAV